ncbi:MAG: hypothetical protein H6Q20_1586 [Bacteroidetes bacterium]|nr:hypothetical protein [Bacteroidota bacterium]
MRSNLYKIVYGLLLIAFVSSCDKENIGEIYTPGSDEPVGLSLLWSTGTLKYTPDVTEATIPVVRTNTNGELTVPLTLTYNNAVFSIPTSVTFADGEEQALVKFSLANAELSKSYTVTVDLNVDSTKLVKYGTYTTLVNSVQTTKKMAYGVKKATVTVLKDYSWESLGESKLNSTWFVKTGLAVQMQKAKDYDVYRAVNPYGTGYNMVITVNGTTATVARQQVGLESAVAPLFAQGTGTFINKVFTLSLDFRMYYPTINDLYYEELGDEEVFTLP